MSILDSESSRRTLFIKQKKKFGRNGLQNFQKNARYRRAIRAVKSQSHFFSEAMWEVMRWKMYCFLVIAQSAAI